MRLALLATLLLGACTVESVPSAEPDAGADAAVPPDAADPAPGTCDLVPPRLAGTMLNVTAERRTQPDWPGRYYYVLSGDFDSDAQPDKLSLKLWEQMGGFNGDVVPGTYQIVGDDQALETCGVCTTVLGNFAPPAQQFFVARRGTLTITTVEPTLAGTLTNFQFAQFDGATGALIEGGCTTSLPSAQFSAPVTTR
jgi:hypothetical protein